MNSNKELPTDVHLGHIQSNQANEVVGEIIMQHENGYMVKSQSGQHYLAKPSLTCLLTPHVGDLVYLTTYQDKWFILHILERMSDAPLEISTDDSLTLSSTKGIALNSNQLKFAASKTELVQDEISLTANKAVAYTKDATVTGTTMLIKFQSLISRLRDSFKHVERMDQTNAGTMIQVIKNIFSTRGQHVDVQAKKDVKINGKRIHMG